MAKKRPKPKKRIIASKPGAAKYQDTMSRSSIAWMRAFLQEQGIDTSIYVGDDEGLVEDYYIMRARVAKKSLEGARRRTLNDPRGRSRRDPGGRGHKSGTYRRAPRQEEMPESYEAFLRRLKTYQLRMMLKSLDSEAEKRLVRVELRRRGQL